MKPISFSRKSLVSAVNLASRATDEYGGQPILAYLKVEIDDKNDVRITGQNTILYLKAITSCNSSVNTSFVVHAGMFSGILSACSADIVDLVITGSKNDKLKITSGSYVATVPVLSSDQFLLTPSVKDTSWICVKCSDLKTTIKRTSFAVAVASQNEALNGFHINIINNDTFIVATDSLRMAYSILSTINTNGDISVVVPTKAIKDLMSLLNDIDDNHELILLFDDKVLHVELPSVSYITNLIDSPFVNWNAYISVVYAERFKTNRSELQNAFKRAQSIARFDNGHVVMSIIDKEIKLIVEGEHGLSNETLICDYENTVELSPWLNIDYAIQALDSIDCHEVEFGMNESAKPFEVKGVGDNTHGQVWIPLSPR